MRSQKKKHRDLKEVLAIGLDYNKRQAAPISGGGGSIVPLPDALVPYRGEPAYPRPKDDGVFGEADYPKRDYNRGDLMRRYQRPQQDGYGVGMWEGEQYVGDWTSGRPNGNGKLHGDDFYEGDWKDGVREGTGTSFWDATTIRFVGEWRGGMPYNGVEYTMEANKLGEVSNGKYGDVRL